jgi:hypothetical protein
VSDPDYREGSNVVSAASKVRFAQVRRAVMRALVGQGAGGEEDRRGGDTWDIVGLPLGGRMKVTGARLPEAQSRIFHWMRRHEERRHWGAVAWFNRFPHAGLSVQMTLEDFALIVGRLARLERERRRWLDGPADHT